MKTPLAVTALATASALLLFSGPLSAADARTKLAQAKTDETKSSDAQSAIVYKAPLRGAPVTRVGGGTRSVATKQIALSALAPSETGYTMRDKPTIYWYVSEDLTSPVELTVVSTENLEEAAKPALELKLQPPIRKGLHALSLEEHGVTLKPGVEYQWFVAVVNDAAQRSGDVVAGGSIKRVGESDAVRVRLAQAAPLQRAAVYAGEGIWYDALDQLSQLIRAEPANYGLRAQRAGLLEQVGLTEAARYDRAR